MKSGTPDEPSNYRRYGHMLTNAEHTQVTEKQIRQQTRKAARKALAEGLADLQDKLRRIPLL